MSNISNYCYDEGGVYIKGLQNTAEQLGIGQYRFPHCYELEGKDFTVTAGGKDYAISFECKHFAKFNGVKCDYEIEKLNKELYFVRFGIEAVAVLDLEAGQAALVVGDEVLPGVIAGSGASAPKFTTDDMVETKVRWILGCGRYITRDFIAADKLRASWSPLDEKFTEVPYKAVKFRDSFYFVAERSFELKNVCAPFFTNKVFMLQDYERCMTVGCVMGTGFDPIMIAGYAKFVD